jgi:2-polyprenyl-6-methoxyphenol hydroxylase-like FAD-dependent oxidoreductase
MGSAPMTAAQLDVLVVGAGPTGLTLACQLARFSVRFRIIDKQPDRAGESRALGVQARSLEVLQAPGLGEALAARGRTTTLLCSTWIATPRSRLISGPSLEPIHGSPTFSLFLSRTQRPFSADFSGCGCLG